MEAVLPLKGVQIVSLAVNVPGPVAVAELQQKGASVIKVEPPDGDPLSKLCPPWYQSLIEGQQVIKINLKDEWERAKLDDLLEEADILITSMRPAAFQRISYDWKMLHRLFPRLSYVAIVGQAVPNENLAGHDLTYQAAIGTVSLPDVPPVLLADMAAAERVVSVVLTLLLAREKGFETSYMQVSIKETAESFAASLRYKLTGKDGLLGGKMPNYGVYRTRRGGWIALAALEPHFWQRLNAELGLSNAGRKDLEKIFLTRSAAEWKTWADGKDIPLEIVKQTEGNGFN